MNKIAGWLFVVFAMAGCATPYQSSGFRGGFTDTQLAPDAFRVTFTGNGYTGADRAQDFALLRASELTLQAGYPYFAIVNENETTQKGSITTPSQTTTTGSVTAAGNTAYYSGYTTTTPGSTFFYFKPSTGLLIRCFASKPDGIYVFEASFIQRSIKNKYGIN